MDSIKAFIISLVIMVALDGVWLGVLMSHFYKTNLGVVAKKINGVVQFNLAVGSLAYILLGIGIVYFVVPRIIGASFIQAFGVGALFGFVVYGIYDVTNFATLAEYPLALLFVDIIWGMFLCGLTAGILSRIL